MTQSGSDWLALDVANQSVKIVTNNSRRLGEVSVNPLTKTYILTSIQQVVDCNAVYISIGVRTTRLVVNNDLRCGRVDVQLLDVRGLNIRNLKEHSVIVAWISVVNEDYIEGPKSLKVIITCCCNNVR